MNRKKTIQKLNKVWRLKPVEGEGDTIPVNERVMYTDYATVLGIVPKTKSALNFLQENFDLTKESKVPELEFKEGGSKYSTYYVQIILEIIKGTEEEAVKISTGEDYPLMVETQHFNIYLAPRVEGE